MNDEDPVATTEEAPRRPNLGTHLRQIESAKEQWALENKKKPGDLPTDSDLFGADKYMKAKPTCPSGGTYTLGAVGEKPSCSLSKRPSHRLP